MKSDLKRIEATLQHLGIITGSDPQPAARQNRSYSFEIGNATQNRTSVQMSSKGNIISSKDNIQSFPAQQSAYKEPTLPNFQSHVTPVRSGSNSSLKMHRLKAPPDAATCKAELGKIISQIKALYLEGPIVDGWLESYYSKPEPRGENLSHEPVAYSIDYVKEYIEQGKVTCESPRAGYRLCGLDAAGQKWSYSCPLEQLASVTIAIARYQKLQQLLERKRYFEKYLRQNNE